MENVSQKQKKLTRSQVFKKLSQKQKQAADAVMREFKTASRTTCVSACATGKSRIGMIVTRRMKGHVNIIAVPTLQLVQQMIDLIIETPGMKQYAILPVCSAQDGESPEDWDIHNATTDSNVIRDVCQANQPVIVVVTYPSFPKLASAIHRKVKVDLLVSDEAHRTAGTKGAHWTECLNDKTLRIAKRLFMTATPVVYRGENETAYSMTDEKVYGRTCFEYTYREAYEDGVVALVKTTIFSIPTESAAEAANNLSEPQQQAFLAESLAAQMLRPRQKTKMLVFHNSLEASERFAKKLQSLGVNAIHLHGGISVKERLQKIDEFSASKQSSVICAVKVFSEGVDAPEIDTIVFADRKSSKIDIVQSIGRGTRWTEDKNGLLVVVPYFTQRKVSGKQIADELIASKYGPLLDVVAALENMDESQCEYRVEKCAKDKCNESDGMRDVDTDDQDKEDKMPLARRVLVVKKIPIVKVTIKTCDGEFDAQDVRRQIVRSISIYRWPHSLDAAAYKAIEVFGKNRPRTTHVRYNSLVNACKHRKFTTKDVLNKAYGDGRMEWPVSEKELLRAIAHVFGSTRPTASHRRYGAFVALMQHRKILAKTMLDKVYGVKMAEAIVWPNDLEQLTAMAWDVFGKSRPTKRHHAYQSFVDWCRGGVKGYSARSILDSLYGVGSVQWPSTKQELTKLIQKIFGSNRPSSSHPRYRGFQSKCRELGLYAKSVLDDVYGADRYQWPSEVRDMKKMARKVFGSSRPKTNHPAYRSLRGACVFRGIKVREFLDQCFR